jgi:hypothetical protein
MSDFSLYFQLGLEHIADLRAYDHMIFIISLCVIFKLNDWKKVLILVTAFTIGHSITLALSVLDRVKVDKALIETLIPITILLTCIINIYIIQKNTTLKSMKLHYALALFFGLIHGLGFANYLKSLLMGMGDVTLPLFSFNVGIEVGQIMIVASYFLLFFLIQKVTRISFKTWVTAISTTIALISIQLIYSVAFSG